HPGLKSGARGTVAAPRLNLTGHRPLLQVCIKIPPPTTKEGLFMRVLALSMVLLLLLPLAVRAQRPDTVFLEDLTFDEIRDLIRGGAKNVIVGTGGTEDNGPHMIIGKHNYVTNYTSDKIARTLGNTLVAPVIAYVPEGSWDPPSGHMMKPGSISLPD